MEFAVPVEGVTLLRYALFTAVFLILVSCNSDTDPVGHDLPAYSLELVSPQEGDTYGTSEKLPVEWMSDITESSEVIFELLHDNTVITKLTLISTQDGFSFDQALSDVTVSDSTYSVRIYYATNRDIIASSGLFSITVENSNTNNKYEPNDTRKAATLVKVSDNQLHSISLSDDDWFAVPVNATDSFELTIDTYYGTVFYSYWASELRAGTALENYRGTTMFTKTISGITDTLFVRVTKNIPHGIVISGPSSNEHNYYVTLRDLRDQSLGTLEADLEEKTYNEGDTINVIVKSSLEGSIYLYRDESSYLVLVETFDGKAVSYVIPKYTTSGSYYFGFKPRGGTDELTSAVFSVIGTSVEDIYEDDDNMRDAKNLLAGESQLRTLTASDTDYIKIPTVKFRDTRISIITPDSITAYTALVQGKNIHVYNDIRPTKTPTGYSFLLEYPTPDTIGLFLWRHDRAVITDIEYTVSAEAVEKQTGIILDTLPLKSEYRVGDTISLDADHAEHFVFDFSFELYCGETRIAAIIEEDSDIDWVIPYSLAGGEYRIKIKALDGPYPDSTFTESFTVVSTMVNDDINEPNDDSTSAKVLTRFNTPVDGTLLYGDIDWFKFPVDKKHRYSLSVISKDSLSEVDVDLDVPGWDMGYHGGEQVIYNSAGDVFVKIYAASADKGGNYTLKVKRFSNDSLLIFSKPKEGAEYKAGDTLVHSIENTHLLSRGVQVFLCKGDKQLVRMETYERYDTVGEKIVIPEGHLAGNDYYFKVSAYEDSSIHSTSPFFTINGVDADSYEPNNSKDSASILPASFLEGVSITGTLYKTLVNGSFDIKVESDVDWYGIVLPPQTTLIIQSEEAAFSSTSRDTFFLKEITNTNATEAMVNFSVSSGCGEYTLKVMDDVEPNDSRLNAVVLPASMVENSDTLYKHFIDDEDIDWYSIDLLAGTYCVTTELINASHDRYDEANITAYVGASELSHGTDSLQFTIDADATVDLKYEPTIFWSNSGITKYSIAIAAVP